ncbi:hypothetical protein [Streptomyces sirii]|uniref:hypothetical protein n=1 Tax=Streptomyces sirii TaxID=3127701 RepID=UPI003D3650DF
MARESGCDGDFTGIDLKRMLVADAVSLDRVGSTQGGGTCSGGQEEAGTHCQSLVGALRPPHHSRFSFALHRLVLDG